MSNRIYGYVKLFNVGLFVQVFGLLPPERLVRRVCVLLPMVSQDSLGPLVCRALVRLPRQRVRRRGLPQQRLQGALQAPAPWGACRADPGHRGRRDRGSRPNLGRQAAPQHQGNPQVRSHYT